MDEIDSKIIIELQRNGRLTNQELSERVNLSPSPCHRRVRMLEESGVIEGYSARINHRALGMPIIAFVQVRLASQSKNVMTEFERSVRDTVEITSCYLMTGRQDYLLQVFTSSLDSYELFVRNKLAELPGIGSWESSFVFGDIKNGLLVPPEKPR
ncbi:AsnC family transcriptional regulator [Pokkaliibacter plantistimulans]|uniref:AsnC family transcriptional regulator n=1 Tax=Pokkaliibacter plantistimulans TaxID=1635171 RepID=A0ABX5M2A7_9GAMM|nr:Lrp/AsnC family transcriptional regulator [Pokkaliibacter plantistimulans]PXF31868.1 AsnC family transcriptional regulator [Pokkaliibacter plantistimulans]